MTPAKAAQAATTNQARFQKLSLMTRTPLFQAVFQEIGMDRFDPCLDLPDNRASGFGSQYATRRLVGENSAPLFRSPSGDSHSSLVDVASERTPPTPHRFDASSPDASPHLRE
jgi:hypothetical protein